MDETRILCINICMNNEHGHVSFVQRSILDSNLRKQRKPLKILKQHLVLFLIRTVPSILFEATRIGNAIFGMPQDRFGIKLKEGQLNKYIKDRLSRCVLSYRFQAPSWYLSNGKRQIRS